MIEVLFILAFNVLQYFQRRSIIDYIEYTPIEKLPENPLRIKNYIPGIWYVYFAFMTYLGLLSTCLLHLKSFTTVMAIAIIYFRDMGLLKMFYGHYLKKQEVRVLDEYRKTLDMFKAMESVFYLYITYQILTK